MNPAAPRSLPDRRLLRPAPVVELPALRAVRLLDPMRERLRMLHDSLRTEEARLR